MKSLPIVEIQWIDSVSGVCEWIFTRDMEPQTPLEVTSIGYLIDDNPAYKTIIQSSSKGQVHSRFTIPIDCIKSIRTLQEPK